MSENYGFLDPEQTHELTPQECELVSLFRLFTDTQRNGVMQTVFTMAANDKNLFAVMEGRIDELRKGIACYNTAVDEIEKRLDIAEKRKKQLEGLGG